MYGNFQRTKTNKNKSITQDIFLSFMTSCIVQFEERFKTSKLYQPLKL